MTEEEVSNHITIKPKHLCQRIDQRGAHVLHNARGCLATKSENALDNTDLGGCRVHSTERAPVVRHQARSDDVAAAVDGSRHQWNL